MAETLSTISIVSYVLSGLFLVISAIIFFKFNIPLIVGDLSGRNARKSIDKIRNQNEKTGNKTFNSSYVNSKRGKLTSKIEDKNVCDDKTEKMEKTEKFKGTESDQPETGLLLQNLASNDTETETACLNEEETASLLDESGTVLLVENQESEISIKRSEGKKMKMIDEVILIHTKEVIK